MHPQVKEELPPDCPREAQAMQQSLEEIQARAKNSEAAAVAPSGTEKFWVCALLGFACVLERCSCILAGTSSGLAG